MLRLRSFLSIALGLLIASELRAAPVATLEGHEGEVTAMAFSPKGDHLLSVGEDGLALVWDVKTQKIVHRSQHKDEKLFAAAWRPDGKQFAVAGEYGVVRVWEVGGKKPVAEYKGHKGPVLSLAFSPNGKFLASGGYMRTIRFWPENDKEIDAPPAFGVVKDMDGRVTSLAFSEDGKSLIVGTTELIESRINDESFNRAGTGGFVRVYAFPSGEFTRQLQVRGSQIAVGGDRVFATGIVLAEKRVKVGDKWELHTGGMAMLSVSDLKKGTTLLTAKAAGLSVACSKDGEAVMCGGLNYRHYAGNIFLGGEESVGYSCGIGKDDKLTNIAIDPRERGTNNIFGGEYPPFTVRDPKTLKQLAAIEEKLGIESLAMAPDGKLVAIGGRDKIQLFAIPEQKK